jgi:hypothetical protein
MSAAPSRPLLAALGLSACAAAYVYGKPLIVGGADGVGDEFSDEPVASTDMGLVADAQVGAQFEVDTWILPAEPRNPFLRVAVDPVPVDPVPGDPVPVDPVPVDPVPSETDGA